MTTPPASVLARLSRRAEAGGAFILGALLAVPASLLLGRSGVIGVGIVVAVLAAVMVVPVDIREHRIPDRVTMPAAACIVASSVVGAFLLRDPGIVVGMLIGGAATGVVGVLMWKFSGLGLGDVKLAGVLGLAFGPAGITATFTVFLITFLTAFIAAIVLLVARRANRGSYVAFAPYLAAGSTGTAVFLPLGVLG